MPLPTPNSGEDRSDFMNRCMANPTMNIEYPDSSQRFAVCGNQWEENRTMSDRVLLEREDWVRQAKDKEGDFDPLRKGIATKIRKIDEENRSFEIVISSEVEDRDRPT